MAVINNSSSGKLIYYSPNYELTMVFTVLSSMCLLLVVGILVASRNPLPQIFKKKYFIIGACSLACMVSAFQMLSYHTEVERKVNLVTRILIEILGIVLVLTGTRFFHLPPDSGNNRNDDNAGNDNDDGNTRRNRHARQLNHKDEYFAGFALFLVIPMIIFISILCYSTMKNYTGTDGKERAPDSDDYLFLLGTIASIIQKLTQSLVYYYQLQHQTPITRRRTEAMWFLRALSLFNFLMWLNDLLNLSSANDKQFQKLFKDDMYIGTSVVYDSIMVEYRLLFSMLFLEQSLEICLGENGLANDGFQRNSEYEELPNPDVDDDEPVYRERIDANTIRLNTYAGVSFIIGVFLIMFQFLNILEYTIPAGWPNIFGIITDIVLVTIGILLYLEVRRRVRERVGEDENNHGAVDLLVIVMGIFAFLYWLFRATVVSCWARFNGHGALVKGKSSFFKAITTSFLMFMFANVPRDIHTINGMHQNVQVRWFLPLFFMAIFASYINSIVATYNGLIDEYFLTATSSIGYQILYQAGGPIHLAFCLHVFVHFFYICKATLITRRRRRGNGLRRGDGGEERDDRNGEDAPLFSVNLKCMIVG